MRGLNSTPSQLPQVDADRFPLLARLAELRNQGRAVEAAIFQNANGAHIAEQERAWAAEQAGPEPQERRGIDYALQHLFNEQRARLVAAGHLPPSDDERGAEMTVAEFVDTMGLGSEGVDVP